MICVFTLDNIRVVLDFVTSENVLRGWWINTFNKRSAPNWLEILVSNLFFQEIENSKLGFVHKKCANFLSMITQSRRSPRILAIHNQKSKKINGNTIKTITLAKRKILQPNIYTRRNKTINYRNISYILISIHWLAPTAT